MTNSRTQNRRHNEAHITQWRRDGATLIERLLTPEEVAPVVADFEKLYGERAPANGEALSLKQGDQFGIISRDQFKHFDDMPFDCSEAMNLIALHPAIIALAKDALQAERVHLYQAHSWVKYTGDADYDQQFHCDFKNHTLTVPADEEQMRTINMMIYFTDVTDEHGAIHYVTQSDSDTVTGPDRTIFPTEEQQHGLKAKERSGAGPAGSVFAYGIDAYHRGTNLTAPNGRRFTLTASYKVAGNDMIGWSAWPISFMRPWHLIINNATPEQLNCLGIPMPGDVFWTERTLRRTQERWPEMNLEPYRTALQ